MSRIALSTLEAHEKLTARIFIQPHGESGYQDVGNVKDYKYVPDNQYRTRLNSDKGFRFVDDEQLDSTHQKWECTLDEQDEYNTKLIYLGTRGADTVQVASLAQTASFTNVKQGRTYFLPQRPVSNVDVQVGLVTKVEGTDYTIDADAGSITILDTGTINDNDDIDVTFDFPDRNFENHTVRDDVLFRGAIKIIEYNQMSDEPLREIDFTGIIRVSAWPEQTGEFGQYAVTVTATTKPSLKKAFAAGAGGDRT